MIYLVVIGILFTYVFIEMHSKNRPMKEVILSSIVFPVFWVVYFWLWGKKFKEAYNEALRKERYKKWRKDNGYDE